MVAAVKNEWGKTFTLGDRQFEIKDLEYYDYLEFITLAKPLVAVAASGIALNEDGGELKIDFDPTNLDFDKIISLAGKELPRLAYLVCRQSEPKIKEQEVAMLARRPQRLIEVILLQILHNKMIEEFGAFFQRLTAMVSTMLPDAAKVMAPSEVKNESTTEETPSS